MTLPPEFLQQDQKLDLEWLYEHFVAPARRDKRDASHVSMVSR